MDNIFQLQGSITSQQLDSSLHSFNSIAIINKELVLLFHFIHKLLLVLPTQLNPTKNVPFLFPQNKTTYNFNHLFKNHGKHENNNQLLHVKKDPENNSKITQLKDENTAYEF